MRPNKNRLFLFILLCVALLVAVPDAYAQYSNAQYSNAQYSNNTYPQSYRIYPYQAPDRKRFGEPGRDGRNGRDGRAASRTEDTDIRILSDLAAPVNYNLTGNSGRNGEDATVGEPARYCRITYLPPYSLQGASGGDGGDGGDGGNGSNGSNVSIYYTDESVLKQVTIQALGGSGGQAGRGTVGQEGCKCAEPEWTVNLCQWDLFSRRTDVPDAEWIADEGNIVPCSGVKSVDERENVPAFQRRHNRANTAYQWVYRGVTKTQKFNCNNGANGKEGRSGREGQDGQYGSFRLIPGTEVPRETTRYRSELNPLIGRTIQFSKNIWVERRNLRDLLSSGSNVPSRYTYLKNTLRPKLRLEWTAADTPENLGVADTEITANMVTQGEQPQIELDIPGTLDYTRTQESGIEVATITGGFSPSRVRSFRIDSVTASADENRLVLIDEGDTRALIPQINIEVTLLTKRSASGRETPNYQPRHSVNFTVSPGSTGLRSSSLNIAGNVYTIDLSSAFRAWLKPGNEASYVVNIQQTTNSGAIYTQRAETAFQV
ncbi:MAG: hypothetical protein AB8B99_13675 [Phormidesmis sp.]